MLSHCWTLKTLSNAWIIICLTLKNKTLYIYFKHNVRRTTHYKDVHSCMHCFKTPNIIYTSSTILIITKCYANLWKFENLIRHVHNQIPHFKKPNIVYPSSTIFAITRCCHIYMAYHYQICAQSNALLQNTKHCISFKHNIGSITHDKDLHNYMHCLKTPNIMYISSTIFVITKCYAILESFKTLSNVHKQMSPTSKPRSKNTWYFVYLSSTKNKECVLKNGQAFDYFAKLVKKQAH